MNKLYYKIFSYGMLVISIALLILNTDELITFLRAPTLYPIGVNYDHSASIYASGARFILFHTIGILLSVAFLLFFFLRKKILTVTFFLLGLLSSFYPIVFI